MPEQTWIAFWFDGNLWFKLCDNATKWRELVAAYDGDIDLLRQAKSTHRDVTTPPDRVMNFGFRGEHRSSPTLGEWADVNHLDLTLAGTIGIVES